MIWKGYTLMPDTTAASSIQTADLQEALYYLSMCIYLADKRPLDRASFLGLLEIASSALLRAGYTQESALVTQTGNLIGQTSPASLVATLKDVWGVIDRGTPTEGVVVWPEYSSDVSTALSKAVIYASQLLTFQGNASDKDLRPEYLGCLGYIETILLDSQCINTACLFVEYRKDVQLRNVVLTPRDVIWLKGFSSLLERYPNLRVLERRASSMRTSDLFGDIPSAPAARLPYTPDILLTGADTHALAIVLLRKYLTGYAEVYCSPERLPEYTDDRVLIYWPATVGLLRHMDARELPLVCETTPFNMDGVAPAYLPVLQVPRTPPDGLVTMHYRKRTDAMLDAQKVVTCVHGPLQYATMVRLRRSLYIRWGSFEDESLLREHLIQEGILSY